MTHYVPIQQAGAWHVAYANHRGELVSVLECGTFAAAYQEAASMTLEATKRALCGTPQPVASGNRYLRAFA